LEEIRHLAVMLEKFSSPGCYYAHMCSKYCCVDKTKTNKYVMN